MTVVFSHRIRNEGSISSLILIRTTQTILL